ncbi:ANTH domain-containing protein [Russula brevipes]|nr:ANTH domain-containing protein [Russula brevipes]
MSSFEKVVKNACKPKPTPPKAKYIDTIIAATWSEDGAIHDVCKALSPRFREPNSIVVFKALIVLHTMIRNGSTDNVLQYLSSSEVLRLKNVAGGQWEGYNAPTNLQHYALYLDTRIRSYRDLKHDAIRVQAETNRDLRLSMSLADDARSNHRHAPEEDADQVSSSQMRRKTVMGRKLRIMTVEKGLLRETKVVQKTLDALVECRLYLDDLEDELTVTALRMLVKDLLILFQAVNEGVINVLEHYFEMSHVDAEQALVIYRHFCKQAKFSVEYLGVAKKLQNLLNVPIPSLKHAPVSLVGALEEYLNDPNFEQNRIEYKANKASADRNLKNGRTVATKKAEKAPSPSAATVPEDSSSKETPKAETTKALTDFFESIDSEKTTIFNPQSGSSVTSAAPGQPQHATYNPFQAAGTAGPSTNPFPQIQAQPQPTGFLQPQFTAVPGFAQQPPNPFPGLQTTSPNFLQSQMTGVNPFRGGALPIQPTGLSPTNPFPSAGQTTNPFPAVANANPFSQLTISSVPNPAASPNPFSSTNSNPFPGQSSTAVQRFPFAPPTQPTSTNLSNSIIPAQALTSTAPALPTRPASTPLTHTRPSSPPLQPLKPHQTGSRNPFGVPRAPSPPPVPRLPTLFELANNAAQPQLQPQSPVQVKPQPTGMPTTTFTSVASSFVTGGPGGAQAPQATTSSPTSLGLPSMITSTPTSFTATTTTGSTSSDPLFSSFGGQPTGSTALSSQPTGAPLRPQATGFNAGMKTFKPTSSFGASLLEALPPIPQSAPTTPALGGGPGFGSSLGLGAQPTGFPTSGGLSAFGGSSVGVGLRPQATGLGVGAGVANPFRASIFTPGVGASAGGFPAFGAASANASTGLYSQPTGAPSFGQSLFVRAPMDASKQQNGAASLI